MGDCAVRACGVAVVALVVLTAGLSACRSGTQPAATTVPASMTVRRTARRMLHLRGWSAA